MFMCHSELAYFLKENSHEPSGSKVQLWRTQIQTQFPEKVSHFPVVFLLLNVILFLVAAFEFRTR